MLRKILGDRAAGQTSKLGRRSFKFNGWSFLRHRVAGGQWALTAATALEQLGGNRLQKPHNPYVSKL
jgi:hypothetical protein